MRRLSRLPHPALRLRMSLPTDLKEVCVVCGFDRALDEGVRTDNIDFGYLPGHHLRHIHAGISTSCHEGWRSLLRARRSEAPRPLSGKAADKAPLDSDAPMGAGDCRPSSDLHWFPLLVVCHGASLLSDRPVAWTCPTIPTTSLVLSPMRKFDDGNLRVDWIDQWS